MDSRQSRLLFLLFAFAWLWVGRGKKSAVWEGQNAILQCADKVNDTFDRIWTKYEKGSWETAVAWFHGESDYIVPDNSPLNTEKVTMNDDGSLEIANASYPKSSGIFKYTNGHIECVVSLSVYQKMKSLTLHGFHNMMLENSDVSFTCMVDGGYPAPVIAWEVPDTVLMPEVNSSAYQSIITFTVSKDQNHQELKCRASIYEQSLVEGYRFNISYKPIVNITSLGKQAFYTEGETETLLCSVKGNPKPEITWMHGGRPLIDETTTNDGNSDGEAVVNSITVKFDPNNRSYSCTATNAVGSEQAFLSLTGIGLILIGLVGAVTASGLALIIAGMWFCYRQCDMCRQRKQDHDIDVDSQGYQSHIAVARFFESNSMRLTGSIGSAQSCRTSGTSTAVGDYETDETENDIAGLATTSMNRLEAVAEVHYLPMDGSAKLKSRKQEADLVLRDSFNSVVYANQQRTARESVDDVPQKTDDSMEYLHPRSTPAPGAVGQDFGARPKQVEAGAEIHYLPMDGSEKVTTRTESDDSMEYLHPRSTPAPGAVGQEFGARPKQVEVAAEIHYLPMDGYAKVTTRKETVEAGAEIHYLPMDDSEKVTTRTESVWESVEYVDEKTIYPRRENDVTYQVYQS